VGLMLPETLYELIKDEMDKRGQLTVAETCRSIIGEWGYKKREEKAESMGNEIGIPND